MRTRLDSLRPLAFCLSDGRSFTYVPDSSSVRVVEGARGAHTVVELAYNDWCTFYWELETCFALLYADRLAITQGSFGHLAMWEPLLRCVIGGQDFYDLEHPDPVLDATGAPLDVLRRYSLDDDLDAMADFLARAGYLHLTSVLDTDDVAALRRDVDDGIAAARPDDRRSWWTSVDGQEVCSRVNYLNERSALIAGLGEDERFVRIASLGGSDLRCAADRLDGNGVVIKVPGATGGLSDLPWHHDCGMGGHPVKCPMLNVGIQLDAATPESGQLVMIPGSHRGTSQFPGPRQADALEQVALRTEPGDVTVHFGHILHAAPPPSDRRANGRRAVYLSFVPPITFATIGPGKGYNDVIFTRDEGRVLHADEFSHTAAP